MIHNTSFIKKLVRSITVGVGMVLAIATLVSLVIVLNVNRDCLRQEARIDNRPQSFELKTCIRNNYAIKIKE